MTITEAKLKEALAELQEHLRLNDHQPNGQVPIPNFLAQYFVASIRSQGAAMRTAHREGQGMMKSQALAAVFGDFAKHSISAIQIQDPPVKG